MPELPEVETTARGLRALVVGRTIVGATHMDWPRMLPNTTPEALAAAVQHLPITAIDRRGKYLIMELGRTQGDRSFQQGSSSEGAWGTQSPTEENLPPPSWKEGGRGDGAPTPSLLIHRKMTGNLLLRPAGFGEEPHTHLVLHLDDGCELRFVDPRKFGRVYLFASQEEQTAFLEARLGPEPLHALEPGTLAERLRNRRGRIKALLLDQAIIAGIGNIYADEALWEAQIHPFRPADSLTRREIARLAAAIQHVLALAVERRGTSFSDYRDAEGLLGENQAYLNAYGRGAGRGQPARPCPRCDTPIARDVLGQRSAHYCPRCQRLSGRRLTRPAASGSAPLT